MSQHCEFETARGAAGARCHEAPERDPAEERIDLERLVWDPEYRDQVVERLKTTG